jgi:hypothetical protein
LKRRLRSFLIALAVLALSAGVALAGRAIHPTQAPATGPTVDQGDQGEAGDGDEAEAPETEAPDADEAEAPETDAPDADGANGEHPDNHGKLVSEAAQLETPAGFDSHGAYVRTVAKDNHGHEESAAAAAKRATKAPKN